MNSTQTTTLITPYGGVLKDLLVPDTDVERLVAHAQDIIADQLLAAFRDMHQNLHPLQWIEIDRP